jgi:hypothetical protein
LNDTALVRRVCETCVPVALNANRIPADAGGAFFKAVLKKQGWPQGIWVVAPDGRILAHHYFKPQPGEAVRAGQERWKRETQEALEAGLKAFGEVKPREPKQVESLVGRGAGCCQDGSVRVALYCRLVRGTKFEGPPVIDSVQLSKEEWAAFTPPKAQAGAGWSIRPEVAKRFVPALSPITDSIYSPRPGDAKDARLTAEVEAVTGGVARVRLTGHWETEHFRDGDGKLPLRMSADAEGVALYDVGRKKMVALLLVLKGTYRNVPPYDKPQQTTGVIEWVAEKE